MHVKAGENGLKQTNCSALQVALQRKRSHERHKTGFLLNLYVK